MGDNYLAALQRRGGDISPARSSSVFGRRSDRTDVCALKQERHLVPERYDHASVDPPLYRAGQRRKIRKGNRTLPRFGELACRNGIRHRGRRNRRERLLRACLLAIVETVQAAVAHRRVVERNRAANRAGLHERTPSTVSTARSPGRNQGASGQANRSITARERAQRTRLPEPTERYDSSTKPPLSRKAISRSRLIPTVCMSQHGTSTSESS